MPQLYNVGWGADPSQIETSVRQELHDTRIEFKKGDPTKYITFDNITFERKKDAELSTNFKDAVINKKSILTKIRANIIKVDNGKRKVVARKVLIGHLPQLVKGRNTFVVNGTEYNLVNQLRRKSGTE